MSATIGYGLRTKKAEDFEQMAAYATKLTREWSLKELGYDMPSEMRRGRRNRDSIVRDIVWERTK